MIRKSRLFEEHRGVAEVIGFLIVTSALLGTATYVLVVKGQQAGEEARGLIDIIREAERRQGELLSYVYAAENEEQGWTKVYLFNYGTGSVELDRAFIQGRQVQPLEHDDNLVLWLSFDENKGTVAHDLSGHGNHSTLHNGPSWTADAKYGSALSFDGTDDYVEVADSPSLDISDEITIQFWLRLNVLGDYLLFAKNNYTNYNYGVRIISPGNKIEFSFYDTTNTWRQTFSSALPWETGVWYHITITYKNTEGTRFYRNGCSSEFLSWR